jgi:hypothetical protein
MQSQCRSQTKRRRVEDKLAMLAYVLLHNVHMLDEYFPWISFNGKQGHHHYSHVCNGGACFY